MSLLPASPVTILTTTTYVIPAGVMSLQVEAIGGGGAGRSPQPDCSKGGGGGGAYAKTNSIRVIPGKAYVFTVGLGGADNSSSDGSPSSMTGEDGQSVLAAAGKVGPSILDHHPAVYPILGGAGGAAADCVGDVTYSGGKGGDCVSDDTVGGGGGGSAYSYHDGIYGGDSPNYEGGPGAGGAGSATGGTGGHYGGIGTAGAVPGAGGGGAGYDAYGRAGGNGRIIVTYGVTGQTTRSPGGGVSNNTTGY